MHREPGTPDSSRGGSFFHHFPVAELRNEYHIQEAFPAKHLGMAKDTHSVNALQQKFCHLRGLSLQQINEVEPLLLTRCTGDQLWLQGAAVAITPQLTCTVRLKDCGKWTCCPGRMRRRLLDHIRTRRHFSKSGL